jgi:hypothetical protein
MLLIERLRHCLGVSPRVYRAFRNRPLSQSQRKDMLAIDHIGDQFSCLWAAMVAHA